MSAIRKVGVIGAGQMGIGIAQVAAVTAKLPVVLYDSNASQLESKLKFLDSMLAKDVEKGKMTIQEKKEAFDRIRTATSLKDFQTVDFVIEAVKEDLAVKRSIFEQLSAVLDKQCILGTNTSSISITKLAAAFHSPQNVIGMHFMNPGKLLHNASVPVMKLVEVINGLCTSDETYQSTIALAQQMQKITTKSVDVPGFIANRLLMPYINEAVFALQEVIFFIDFKGNRKQRRH